MIAIIDIPNIPGDESRNIDANIKNYSKIVSHLQVYYIYIHINI